MSRVKVDSIPFAYILYIPFMDSIKKETKEAFAVFAISLSEDRLQNSPVHIILTDNDFNARTEFPFYKAIINPAGHWVKTTKTFIEADENVPQLQLGGIEIILESEDVLNCAIEIKAQPPGKKLQNLSLLSGGERCLTAIALLFAILQLRPSPFVVLDEVEAALDDVNVSRFTDFVRRYTTKSQFILVTHRKGTMEACDRIYGVTMQERGISKILSMRLGEG